MLRTKSQKILFASCQTLLKSSVPLRFCVDGQTTLTQKKPK